MPLLVFEISSASCQGVTAGVLAKIQRNASARRCKAVAVDVLATRGVFSDVD